ncbi:unnamed protein product [Nippostrongylus brasiliensis]|uniref:Uncharacterized protein n=1 Tax=Nippostrongylus brasiliensis TaxID=27835 RepID=A0A0N4YRU4_NIPBR|nr:unnamed protein product [Nippostrongylus brasiliensis]
MSFDGVSMSTESMKDMTCPEELSAECRVKVIQDPKDQSTSNSRLPVSHERLDRGHPMTVADSPPQFKGWGVLRLRQSVCGTSADMSHRTGMNPETLTVCSAVDHCDDASALRPREPPEFPKKSY